MAIQVPGLARPIPSEHFKDVPCGLCGSAESELRFRDGPFSVVRCKRCGLVYVTPRLVDGSLISEVYDEGYWSSASAKDRGYTDYRADAALYLRTYRKRLAVVRRHFKEPGRVLDVGCAAGYFLSVMQEIGWDVTGLEPSEPIRAQANRTLGNTAAGAPRVLPGLLHEAPLEPKSFDLLTFWDVIEHIPDVVGTLRYARTLLRPGGKLLVETQNVKSRAARLLGPKWQHYKHAEHIYHFDPRTLEKLMDLAGFRILENRARLGGKYVSLGFVAERAQRLHPVIAFCLAPLKLVKNRAVYVNLFDEMILVAEPA